MSDNLTSRLTEALVSTELAQELLRDIDQETRPSDACINALTIALTDARFSKEIVDSIVNEEGPDPEDSELSPACMRALADALADQKAADEFKSLI